MTNEEHNRNIAWVFIGHGAFQLMVAAMIMLMFGFIVSLPDQPGQGPPPAEFMMIMFGFMFVFQMLFVIPSFVAAFALLKKKSWARMAAIVAGVVSAMHVPIGTAACVYAMWFFFGDNWKEVYPDHGREVDTQRPQLEAAREARWTGLHTNDQGEVVFRPVDPPDWR
jgi:hypothetical protein